MGWTAINALLRFSEHCRIARGAVNALVLNSLWPPAGLSQLASQARYGIHQRFTETMLH